MCGIVQCFLLSTSLCRYKCDSNPASALVWEWKNGSDVPSKKFVCQDNKAKHLDLLLEGREMDLSSTDDFDFIKKELPSVLSNRDVS
jgi:hypothetical protein